MPTQSDLFQPVCSLQDFSGFAGVSLRTVESWVLRGHLPTLKIGRHRLVNMAALVGAGVERSFSTAATPAPTKGPLTNRGGVKQQNSTMRNGGVARV